MSFVALAQRGEVGQSPIYYVYFLRSLKNPSEYLPVLHSLGEGGNAILKATLEEFF